MELKTVKDIKEYIDNIAIEYGNSTSAEIVVEQLVSDLCAQDNHFFYSHARKMTKNFILYADELRLAAKTCNERGRWVKKYLDGEMYTDQNTPSDYDKVQSKNASAIINSTAAVLGMDLVCDNDRTD